MDMKIVKIFIISSILVSLSAAAFAEDSVRRTGDINAPPGMEVIKQGDVNVLVPKGSGTHKAGNLVVLESTDEYAARGFVERDNRMAKIESEVREQKKVLEAKVEEQNSQIERLKVTVQSLEQRLNDMKDNK